MSEQKNLTIPSNGPFKYFYRLMCKGKQKKARIADKVYDVDWDAVYYSEPKYVVAANEKIACKMIEEKLKSKWTGFKIVGRVYWRGGPPC